MSYKQDWGVAFTAAPHRNELNHMRPLEAIKFRPREGNEPIEPFSGLDDNDTLLVQGDCGRCYVRQPRQDVFNGVNPGCICGRYERNP